MNNPVAECEAGISVPPDDSRAIAEAIRALAGMTTAERWQMGMRGRAFVEENYSSETLGGRLEEVLVKLVPESHVRNG